MFMAVFQIRRIRMFLALLDPASYPVVGGTDPDMDPDLSVIKQKKSKKNLSFYCFVTSL